MRVGFTGTQQGMTPHQTRKFIEIMKGLEGEFHEGDCVGSDEQATFLAYNLGFKIVVHPPDNLSKRAYTNCSVMIYHIMKPKPYLTRNRAIVDATELLIATPKTKEEEIRSGSWYTVRFARRCGRQVIIINPDGSIS